MKRVGKRLLSFTAACVLTMGVFAGAGCSKYHSRMDKNGNITLSFWSIYPEGDENYKWTLNLIDRFEKENPNIKIN